jgi:hypothetical protein
MSTQVKFGKKVNLKNATNALANVISQGLRNGMRAKIYKELGIP